MKDERSLKGLRAIVAFDDLMIGSRIRETLGRMGMQATFATSPAAGEAPLSTPADLLIADLADARIGPMEIIRTAKRAGLAVLACGSHVDTESLDAARQAGADLVVPRSLFTARLADLIGDLVGRAS